MSEKETDTELSGKLSLEVQKFLIETLKDSKAFVVKEAPEVVKEILEGNFFEAATILISYFTIMALLIAFTVLCFMHSEYPVSGASYYGAGSSDPNLWWYFRNGGMVASVVVAIVGMFLVPGSIVSLYQIKKTPKAYLLSLFMD